MRNLTNTYLKNMKYYLFALLLSASMILNAQDLEISLKNGGKKENEAKIQLKRIMGTYKDKVDKWTFTRKIQIDKDAIPFSHPLLTLNCNFLENDHKQLSNFLHEQFHWLLEAKPTQREDAINKFKELFPNVPSKGDYGARNEYSTYLHLIVCDLEFQAMTKVLGEDSARKILAEWNHYKWIYQKVLNDQRIRKVNKENDFLIL